MQASANGKRPPPPGPKGQGFQNMRRLASDLNGFIDSLHEEYGDIAAYEVPGAKFCAVFSAELMKEVMVDKEPILPPAYPWMHFDIVKSPGLARWRGADHKRLTTLLVDAFSDARMGPICEMLAEQTTAHLERFRPGETVDVVDEFERLSWKETLTALFGTDGDMHREIGRPLLKSVKMGFLVEALPARGLVERLPLPFVRRANKAAKRLDPLAYSAIRRARDPDHAGDDVVSHLVRATEEGRADWTYRNDREIRDEAYALLFGAYEPPVVVIVNALHYLALNPAAREALEREADTLPGDRPISGADLERLPYARAVALESLRLHPVAEPLVGRIALKDTTLGGYSVPKGTRVQVSPRVLQRRPEYWDEPNEFRPERWLRDPHKSELGCPAHPFLGFNKEPRHCRGARFATALMVCALADLARRFRFEPVGDRLPKRAGTDFGAFPGPVLMTVEARARSRAMPNP
jgi:cytochrome P450